MTERAEVQTPTVDATEPVPRYEDEDAEFLGEKLAELYVRRSSGEDLANEIRDVRRDLRRGPRLRAGEFLKDGRYRLIERIGDSAGDATWEAWDRVDLRRVVIKEMVGPWVAKRMRVGTFLEAARTLRELDHPGLAPLHEATQSSDGFVYLATDFLAGGRLDRFEGDATDLIQATLEVASALQVAHEAGLVHARVRPEAIYFDEDGGARIADFDLAGEHVHGDSGTVFVAPELVERGAQATPAADVYALAMTMLYALNGNRLPYTVVRGPERFIDGLGVADSVKTVLKKSVDWELDGRYGSMAELVQDLVADPDVLSELADRALQRNRFEIASEHFTALWKLRPDDSVRIKHVLGKIYLAMESWDEAYGCLAEALEATASPDPLFPDLRTYAEGTDDWKKVADLLWNQARNRPPVARASMRSELARITELHLGDPRGASEVWTLVVQDHRTPERGRQALAALKRLAEERQDWSAFVGHARALLPYLDTEERPSVEYAVGRVFIEHLGDEDEGLTWLDRAEAGGIQPLEIAPALQEIRARRGQWRRLVGLMRLQAAHESHVHKASRILLRAATIARSVHLMAEAEAIYADMLARAPQHYPALRELARMRHRSGRSREAMEAYSALTSTYEGKSEPPEGNERAADHVAYAQLLVDAGNTDLATWHLEAALELQPDNVEALSLVGPLHLDAGELSAGANALEGLATLFKAVNTRGARLEAALRRADAAWYRGRLAVAMRWYNVVHDTRNDDARAWWGLARIALAARGGHPGADRAPWLSATPVGFTPQEGLARLLVVLLRGEQMQAWLACHPLGAGAMDAGAAPARLACLTVDLLGRFGLIDEAFFTRLEAARPDHVEAIEAVRGLFAGRMPGDLESVVRRGDALLDGGFDPSIARAVVFGEATESRRLQGSLAAEEAWEQLLGGAAPDLPERGDPRERVSERSTSAATLELVNDGELEQVFDGRAQRVVLGSAPSADWVVDGLEPRHAAFARIGGALYLEPLAGEVRIDGERVPGWRILGGEQLALGERVWTLRLRDDEAASEPDGVEGSPDGPPPAPRSAGGDEGEETQAAMPALSSAALERALFEDDEPEPDPEPWMDEAETSPADEEDDEDFPTAALPPVSDDDLHALALSYTEEEVGEQPELQPAEPEVDPLDAPPVLAPSEEDDPETEEGLVDEEVDVEPEPIDADDAAPESVGNDESFEDTVEVGPEALAEVARLEELLKAADADEAAEEVGDPESIADAGTVEMGMPGPAEDFEDEATVTIQNAASNQAYSLELDNPPIEPHRPMSSEDSLGPAGDAPTPQWLAPGEFEDMVETQVSSPSAPDLLERSGPAGETGPDAPEEEEHPAAPVEPEPQAPAGPARRGVLEVMSGPSRGTKMAVMGVLSLGRNASCELHLPADPMLSDVHCRFVASEAGFLIMDNGSDRGTMVDGCRVSELALKGGETIMVGSTVLRFVIRD